MKTLMMLAKKQKAANFLRSNVYNKFTKHLPHAQIVFFVLIIEVIMTKISAGTYIVSFVLAFLLSRQ